MDQIARTPAQLGAAIRRRRRQLGLSQTAVGATTRLRQATISAIENGSPSAQLRTVALLMNALGLELVVRERSKASESVADLF